MACITEAASGFPNASGTIPPENGMVPEIIGERGWNTYMVGKWHLCPEAEMNLASPRRNWPTGRGFERFYGFLGAETNQWYPDLVYDNHPVDQPKMPEDGYHLTDDVTDKALEFIKDAKVLAPDKPFFLYYAPGACHAPHHAPKEWIEKFRGRFDMGYEEIREQVLARQKKMGIVPPETELPPVNPMGTPESHTDPAKPFPELDTTRPWGSLSDEEKQLFARMAEVYAGFLAHADHHIGRLLDYLEETGQRPGHPRLRQRGLRRGRPERLGEREQAVQRHRRRSKGKPVQAKRARQPADLQPLPQRVGDGVQHAVQDVEALRVQRGHRGPVHLLLAEGHQGPG
jgi:arylsulfatase